MKKKLSDFLLVTDNIDSWPFMSSPYPVMLTLTLYIAFVTKLGPRYMKNRSPYNLNNVMVAYNAAQVLISLFLVYNGTKYLISLGVVRKTCLSNSNKDLHNTLMKLGYCYMCAKASELLDTILFVLRKKQNQVTFLHVYHHSIMLLFMWIGVKYVRNENFMFMCTINSGVHVIMYAYYGLSMYPSMQKYLWWKKYITIIQLVQFLLVLIQITTSQIVSDCPPSTGVFYFAIFNILFFYYLFNNFYKNCYNKPHKCKTEGS